MDLDHSTARRSSTFARQMLQCRLWNHATLRLCQGLQNPKFRWTEGHHLPGKVHLTPTRIEPQPTYLHKWCLPSVRSWVVELGLAEAQLQARQHVRANQEFGHHWPVFESRGELRRVPRDVFVCRYKEQWGRLSKVRECTHQEQWIAGDRL